MEQYLPILQRVQVFKDLNDNQIISIIKCLNGHLKFFKKGQTLYFEGDIIDSISIILVGSIETRKIDYYGNSNIVSYLNVGETITAVGYYSSSKTLPFDVISKLNCTILILDGKSLTSTCCNSCAFHHQIILNMLEVIADKNLNLSNKIDLLIKRSIREKILAFLYQQSKISNSRYITIKLNRQQMADYLSVDRSALSRELARMQDDNIIEYQRNLFRLK